MTDDKFLLLKMHDFSHGLSDDAVLEIAEECELLKFASGDYLHHVDQPFDSIFLIIHGRVKQTLIDIQGNVLLQRYQTTGGQIGVLAAALSEPSPLEVVAEDPTTILRLNYQKALELTNKYSRFQQNILREISNTVRNVLMKERHQKKPKLIAIFHQSSATRLLTRKLIRRLQALGEDLCILSDDPNWQAMDNVPYYCLIKDGSYVSEQDTRQQINRWSDSRRVLIDISSANDSIKSANVVESSEIVFWCVTPSNWQASVSRLEAIENKASGWREKINLVWLLDDGSQWAPVATALRQLVKQDFKMSFDEPQKHQSRELLNGFERIIHLLRGIKIGIALGGGAARGMAHLGVLKVLEQNGIIIDMIAGTSAGAMTGICYASGMEVDYNVKQFTHDLTPPWLFRHLPSGDHWYLLYKYRLGHFDPMLRKYLKDSRLEQLPIPVNTITVDLISGKAIVREAGDSAHAITESINLPVLSSPINRDGKALVDGGIINNVPADILVSKGCNFVIAVSVTEEIEQVFSQNTADTPTDKMKKASILQTIMRTSLVQNVNMNSVGVQPADFVIAPDVKAFDITEFSRADEMAAIGEQAMRESIPQIKQLLAKIDPNLFAENDDVCD